MSDIEEKLRIGEEVFDKMLRIVRKMAQSIINKKTTTHIRKHIKTQKKNQIYVIRFGLYIKIDIIFTRLYYKFSLIEKQKYETECLLGFYLNIPLNDILFNRERFDK